MRDKLDLTEKGGPRNGQPQVLDRRLFMQLLAFGGAHDVSQLAQAIESAGFDGVLYKDLNDPYGVALLTYLNKTLKPNIDPATHNGYNYQFLDHNPVNRWDCAPAATGIPPPTIASTSSSPSRTKAI